LSINVVNIVYGKVVIVILYKLLIDWLLVVEIVCIICYWLKIIKLIINKNRERSRNRKYFMMKNYSRNKIILNKWNLEL
jgi:hypothetical protein